MGKVKNRETRELNSGINHAMRTSGAKKWPSRPTVLLVLVTFSLLVFHCSGCSDDDLRLVRMDSDTSLFSEPSTSSDRLGRVPAGQLVEILGEGPSEEGTEKKWYEIVWKGKQGFMLLDPSKVEFRTSTSETEEGIEEDAGDDSETDGELSLQPKRLKPANFDPSGEEFSLGLGCTGSTHSEYSVSLSFSENEVTMTDSGLLEYGMPGEACGSTYEEVFVGSYDSVNGELIVQFRRQISRVSTAKFPNCSATKVSEEINKIQRKDRFFMLECDGKHALQMDPSTGNETGDAESHSFADQYFVVQ